MKRRVLSIVAGLLTGFLSVSAGEYLLGLLFPLPAGTDMHDRAQVIIAANKMPLQAFLFLLLIYAVASLAVGIVATLIAQTKNVTNTANNVAGTKTWRPAIICSLVFTLGGVIEAANLMHPTWFLIASALIYVPFTYGGYLIAKK